MKSSLYKKTRLELETLENREVPAGLTWVNRGLANDQFAAAFGAQAATARGVIDAAIADWNEIVTGHHGEDINVALTIRMDPADPAISAFASNVNTDDAGVPLSGTITINMGLNDEGESVWFLDPTPNDHSEFLGSMTNAFARAPTPGGPAAGMRDLRTLVLHEIGHVMGIASGGALMYDNFDVTMSELNVPDTTTGNEGNSYWLFQGPSVNALMTDYDIGAGVASSAGHTALPRPNNTPVVFGNVSAYSTRDIMNPTSLSINRVLISNKVGLMLRDMGYDANVPELFGTMHAVLNQTTGQLTVMGGNDNTIINGANQGVSHDVIRLERIGNLLVVSVNVGDDVPGTGAGMHPTDQQDAFVTLFNVSDVDSIRVFGYGGNDQISFHGDFGFLPHNQIRAYGGAGNDVLNAVNIARASIFYGEDGNDTLLGSSAGDTLLGGVGNDTIYGRAGNDYILGDIGNDHLEGNQGDDTVFGNAGNDRILGGTTLVSNIPFVDGADVLNGNDGNDVVFGDNVLGNAPTLFSGAADTIRGGEDTDILYGGVGNDTLYGEGGNDLIAGSLGHDTVWGGAGNDTLQGNQGNDTLWGVLGDDILQGGTGDDTLRGGFGNDALNGNEDSDTLWGNEDDDILRGDAGNDLLRGGSGNNILLGGSGADELIAGFGRDILIGGAQNDRLVGEAGDDILIAGTTVHDNSNADLALLRAEWTAPRTYAQRVANLSNTPNPTFAARLNGNRFLRLGIDVFHDASNDILSGLTGTDWFFLNLGPDTYDAVAGEEVN